MPRIGLLFPGQGSQSVGMGKELLDAFESARSIYQQADSALGFDLSKVILEGPEENLKQTQTAQPAILTASIAAWSALTSRWQPPAGDCICAGHSLGEYSALVAAGVMDFTTAVALVRKRGEYMQAASAVSGGGMAAVLGLSADEAQALCRDADAGNVQLANLNCPGQMVISGSAAGLEKAYALAKERKIKVIPLAVSGPFHSRFMSPAGDKLGSDLQNAAMKPAAFPVLANVGAQPVTEPGAVRDALIRQVSGAVRWEESMKAMVAAGVTVMVEIGPGKVLRGLMKKIDPQVRVLGAFSAAEIQETVGELQGIII